MECYQRDQRADDEHQNAYRCCIAEISGVYSQLVEPCYKQVGLSCLVVIQRCGSTAGEEVDYVEVVDVAHQLCNEVRGSHEQNIGHRDLCEHNVRRSAVYPCRFIKVLGNVHEDTGNYQHRIRNTYPQVNDDDRHPRPCRVGEERERRRYPAKFLKKNVHGACFCEDVFHYQQRNKLRNRDSEYEKRSVERLEANAFFVYQHRKNDAKEIVQECRKNSPDKGPREYRPECLANGGVAAEDYPEVVEAYPGEQVRGHLMVLVVVCERQ